VIEWITLNSEYARSAVLNSILAFDHLAGKEMEVGG